MKAYTYYLGLILVSQSCIAIKFYQSEAEEVNNVIFDRNENYATHGEDIGGGATRLYFW